MTARVTTEYWEVVFVDNNCCRYTDGLFDNRAVAESICKANNMNGITSCVVHHPPQILHSTVEQYHRYRTIQYLEHLDSVR